MRLLLLYILTDWINRPARKSIYIAIINEYANRHTLRGSFLDESLSDYRYYLSNRCRRVSGFVLLANVNSRSRSLYAIARPSVCLSVCLSVTFVRPTQAVQIFGNISTALGTLAIRWHSLKISPRSSQRNPSAGGVKHKRGSKI